MLSFEEIARRLDERAEQFQRISLQQLQAELAYSKGTKMATVITRTIPEMTKTGNPFFGNLFKLARINVVINPHAGGYQTSVNNQRLRENKVADFVPEPRIWGTRLHGAPFVSHLNKLGQNKLYLELKVEKTINSVFVNSEGIEVDRKEVAPYIRTSPSSTRQQVDRIIKLRDYDVNNIVGIVISGKKYIVD